jgi:hypothetical protein
MYLDTHGITLACAILRRIATWREGGCPRAREDQMDGSVRIGNRRFGAYVFHKYRIVK